MKRETRRALSDVLLVLDRTVTERDDARLERDHYKSIITDLYKDIKPLMDCLQLDTKLFRNPSWTPRPEDGERAKLFGTLDMFNLQARALPNADSLKRMQKLVAEIQELKNADR